MKYVIMILLENIGKVNFELQINSNFRLYGCFMNKVLVFWLFVEFHYKRCTSDTSSSCLVDYNVNHDSTTSLLFVKFRQQTFLKTETKLRTKQ